MKRCFYKLFIDFYGILSYRAFKKKLTLNIILGILGLLCFLWITNPFDRNEQSLESSINYFDPVMIWLYSLASFTFLFLKKINTYFFLGFLLGLMIIVFRTTLLLLVYNILMFIFQFIFLFTTKENLYYFDDFEKKIGIGFSIFLYLQLGYFIFCQAMVLFRKNCKRFET